MENCRTLCGIDKESNLSIFTFLVDRLVRPWKEKREKRGGGGEETFLKVRQANSPNFHSAKIKGIKK